MCQLSLPTALGPLSIFPCLLREGWIPLSEQYPHASLDVFKAFTSSSWRWQSCIHRLKTGPHWVWHKSVFLWSFPLQRIVGRGICAVKPIKLKLHGVWNSRNYILIFSTFVAQVALVFPLFFNEILCHFCVLNCSDHASEVQVTMMLTESCKLRGLHHRWVEKNTKHSFFLNGLSCNVFLNLIIS